MDFLETKIYNFIDYVYKHPMENISLIASQHFAGLRPLNETRDIIIPEILLLMGAKRIVVCNIIKKYLNCDVYDSLDQTQNYIGIKEVGDKFTKTVPLSTKKNQWIY
jgi:hypothetical protein